MSRRLENFQKHCQEDQISIFNSKIQEIADKNSSP